MYATFDRNSPTALDAEVLSLSWKGDPKRGWLATGNSKKTVGVTYTELNDEDDIECESADISLEKQAHRKNFNFREHNNEVTIVRWNNHLDKIATCDSSGTVIVWRNHNGRSIMELVNNRGTPISDFQWSNDGNKVLIAYIDGYVLVGTAYGRRIWARQLNLGSFVTNPSNHTTPSKLMSSTWSPDDSRIVVGSSIGELIELDAVHGGTLVSTTEVLPGIGIIGLQWVLVPNKTNGDTTNATGGLESGHPLASGQITAGSAANTPQQTTENKGSVRLSLYLRNGKVVLMNSCGDQQATIIRTGLLDGKMLWSSDGGILAVAGFRKSQAMSTVRFFQPTGQLLFTLPLRTKESVTAITWGHNDQKLFIATKSLLHSATITRGIPSLQTLCQNLIANTLPHREDSFNLVLPTKLKVAVAESFDPTIQAHIPRDSKLLEYVSKPPEGNTRTYCTVVPNIPARESNPNNPNASTGQRSSRHPSSYTLYVEHLGTLVPILEAHKRSIKLRQSFTISLPSSANGSSTSPQSQVPVVDSMEGDSSMDSGVNSETTTPSQLRLAGHEEAHLSLNTESGVQLACKEDDSDSPKHPLPSNPQPQLKDTALRTFISENSHQLAEVTSNVMASKFKIQSLSEKLPADMGSIMIKTSFLHIQPRKVIAYLPHQESDSGIDSDTSSDESSAEELLLREESNCSVDVFMEPDNATIESLMSMEELQLPALTPNADTQEAVRSSVELSASASVQDKSSRTVGSSGMGPYSLTSTCMKGQRVSMSDSHIQIHSKTPTWNEQHMIYQLDFGGRVTTKSAKNFQLELDNGQVLQFGRIDNGCFILDFQAPFSPIQAFATALANLV